MTANDYGLGLYNGDTGVTVLADGQVALVPDLALVVRRARAADRSGALGSS